MQRVFGAPAGTVAAVLAIVLVVAAGIVTLLALRNLVFFRMGVRNARRRPARSALIVVGLMLGTAIIASALLTGDTMGRTMRETVFESLGATDVQVRMAGTGNDLVTAVEVPIGVAYFDASRLAEVDAALADLDGRGIVDGVAPAIIEPLAVQDVTSRRTEPRISLFAADPARLEPFGLEDVGALRQGEALLDDDAAEELDAAVGDTLVVFTGTRSAELRVAGIASYRGAGQGPTLLVPLDAGQALVGSGNGINHVLVSGAGDEAAGVRHTDAIVAAIDRALVPVGLEAKPVKRDGLDMADAQGNAFMQLFTTFGSFSMAAGILLVFLIFVMLAAERRSEMGMARAVGTRRSHLVQTFLFEGAVYDVAAAAVGAALGVGVSWVMVRATVSAFATEELVLKFSFSARSLVIAYALGVLLTFIVVVLSAWRVSRLNIVSAIRDIGEPVLRGRRRGRWVFIGLGIVTGFGLAAGGASGKQYMPWMLGVSLLIISIVPLVRLVGAPDRAAFTAAGAALVTWWLLPLDILEPWLGEMQMDFSIWIVGGLLIVVGATWLVTYNADVLLGAIGGAASRFSGLAPVMKMAITYPLRSRFRTAVTLAMFTLVVFTLVTGSTIPTAFVSSFDDVDKFGGGFDVRASTAPSLAVADLRPSLPAAMASEVEAIGSQSLVPLEAKQEGVAGDFELYPLRGIDDVFAETTTYLLATMATGYRSAEQVWDAVRTEPGTAVVDAWVVPRRQNWGAGVLPDFTLEGFYIEDESFEPVRVAVRDRQTGTEFVVTVIAVLSDDAPMAMSGLTVSQATLAPLGERATPTMHHVALDQGADPVRFAGLLEETFLANGLEAEAYTDVLDDAVGGSMTFIRLIQGFMGLGLLVGVAALGVVSARAVVERRQQLGVLRAIGFQPQMIRRTLLLEASFVSLTAIVVGTALGLVMAFNVIADSSRQANYADVSFVVPWLNLGVIFAIVYAAALATTLLPAIRASRIYPAEALRYQ